MEVELIASDERGVTETPWLLSHHSFSFGSYYNLKRINFGTLRVLNDDIVQPAKGFPLHHHDNMEIVTIVLEGALQHKDSAGHEGVITAGQVQRMSAGRGISHSEYNASTTEKVHFLQIWVFPRDRDLEPSYEQKSFTTADLHNQLYPIVKSVPGERALLIHQDATFYLGHIDAGKKVTHPLPKNKGAYLFVIKGKLGLGDKLMKTGDAAQITLSDAVDLTTIERSEVLLIEVGLGAL